MRVAAAETADADRAEGRGHVGADRCQRRFGVGHAVLDHVEGVDHRLQGAVDGVGDRGQVELVERRAQRPDERAELGAGRLQRLGGRRERLQRQPDDVADRVGGRGGVPGLHRAGELAGQGQALVDGAAEDGPGRGQGRVDHRGEHLAHAGGQLAHGRQVGGQRHPGRLQGDGRAGQVEVAEGGLAEAHADRPRLGDLAERGLEAGDAVQRPGDRAGVVGVGVADQGDQAGVGRALGQQVGRLPGAVQVEQLPEALGPRGQAVGDGAGRGQRAEHLQQRHQPAGGPADLGGDGG